MIDSLFSGNTFGIVMHNFLDLTLIFWGLKHSLRKNTHILTKTDTVIVFHALKYSF